MDAPSATGSSVTVRRDAAAVAWWVLVGAASGAIAGALVGGVGGRLAMLLLRLTSPDDVIGMTSDDGFEIGVFSFDTAQLVLAMAMLGGDQRRALRRAPWRDPAEAAAAALVGLRRGARRREHRPRRRRRLRASSSPPLSRSRSSCSFPERRPRSSCCSSSAGCASSRGRTGVSRSGSASARSPGRSRSGSQVSSPPQRSSCGGHGSTLCSRALPGSPCPPRSSWS